MAQLALRPHIVEFGDLVSYGETECGMEEVAVQAGSSVVGKPIGEIYPPESGVGTILFIRRSGGDTISAPPPDAVLQADDAFVAFGERDQISRMRGLAQAA